MERWARTFRCLDRGGSPCLPRSLPPVQWPLQAIPHDHPLSRSGDFHPHEGSAWWATPLVPVAPATAEDPDPGSQGGWSDHLAHPDDPGRVRSKMRTGRYPCRIDHHRPCACRRVRCNLAATTDSGVFGQVATHCRVWMRSGCPSTRQDAPVFMIRREGNGFAVSRSLACHPES